MNVLQVLFRKQCLRLITKNPIDFANYKDHPVKCVRMLE